MINSKIKKLFLKMLIGGLIKLLFFDSILCILLISGIRADAKIALGVLFGILNFGAFIYLTSQYKKVSWALGLPSQAANVTLRGHTIINLDAPNEYQTALLQFLGNEVREEKSNLKVEIGMSSVALPNMADSFTATIFMNGKTPQLIVNETLEILATVSGVLEETRAN